MAECIDFRDACGVVSAARCRRNPEWSHGRKALKVTFRNLTRSALPANLALNLGTPTSVELKRIDDASPIAFPKSAIVEYQFPARGKLPPVKLTWYEGGLRPDKPAQLEENRQLARGGQLIIGSKATVY